MKIEDRTEQNGAGTAASARENLTQALLGECPSQYFETLRQNGGLEPWFLEVKDLIGVEQSPIHHAEGDVWTHTMMVLEQSALVRDKAKDPLGFMLGALTHDFGKTICTKKIDGRICSYEHEIKGLPLVERFLHRLGFEPERCAYVLELVQYHMRPNALGAQNSSIKTTNRLFDQVSDPLGLICLAVADGRGKESTLPYVSYEDFLMRRLAIYREYLERPGVTREDLEAHLPPETNIEEWLAFAHKLRLAGMEQKCALSQTIGQARRSVMKNKKFSTEKDKAAV